MKNNKIKRKKKEKEITRQAPKIEIVYCMFTSKVILNGHV